MADISVDPGTWSSTAGSNSPAGATNIGTGLDDNLRAIQAGVKSYLEGVSSVAGTNTITGTVTGMTAYYSGQRVIVVPANNNTGATTLNLTSIGAKNVFWNGAACVGGELRANIPALLEYDGTQFHIIGNGFNAPFLDTHPVVQGSADSTKKVRFEVDGLTTAMTRVITPPDFDMQLGNGEVIAAGRNIAARTNSVSPNTKIDITADEICVRDANGTSKLLSTVSGTIDFGTVGANGLDASTQGASTWYYGWVIAKPDGTVAVLGSASATAPTMPSGYTFKALVTAARSNGSVNFLKYRQFGNWVWYEAGQSALSAGTGTTETATSVSTLVPPIAIEMDLQLFGQYSASGSGGFNAEVDINWVSGSIGRSFKTNVQTSGTAALTGECRIPNLSQNFYYQWNGTTNLVSQSLNASVVAFKLPGGGE